MIQRHTSAGASTANTSTAAPQAVTESDTVANGENPPESYSITDDEFAAMLEDALARGKTPE